MELHIPPISKKSRLDETEFAKGDRVISILARNSEGEVDRIDVLEQDEEKLEFEGKAICRWVQLFKPKSKDDREEREAMKLSADSLFLNLFEDEEGPSQENAKLKQFLSLMLERRRVLRNMGKEDGYIRYIHRPTKIEYFVPEAELDPVFFMENQERLSFLIGGDSEGQSGQADSSAVEAK